MIKITMCIQETGPDIMETSFITMGIQPTTFEEIVSEIVVACIRRVNDYIESEEPDGNNEIDPDPGTAE